jgi:hypothetical protein
MHLKTTDGENRILNSVRGDFVPKIISLNDIAGFVNNGVEHLSS